MNTKMIFSEAKQHDLVTLLAQLGFVPEKLRGQDYWYRSPFRQEQTASFKVNRPRNIWYDHGEGIGGNIIDFAARFFRCDVTEAARKITGLADGAGVSFHPPHQPTAEAGEKKETGTGKILVTSARSLQDAALLAYLNERKIPLAIAEKFCKEVDFSLYSRAHTAIGFQNRSGGFELRSSTFKGSSSPKDVTVIDRRADSICVFEGFFDFLSFATIRPHIVSSADCLILNSLAFFEKSRALMEQRGQVFLFLDRGQAGRQSTQKALGWSAEAKVQRYRDSSNFYRHHEDLNEWLCQRPPPGEQLSHGLRRGH